MSKVASQASWNIDSDANSSDEETIKTLRQANTADTNKNKTTYSASSKSLTATTTKPPTRSTNVTPTTSADKTAATIAKKTPTPTTNNKTPTRSGNNTPNISANKTPTTTKTTKRSKNAEKNAKSNDETALGISFDADLIEEYKKRLKNLYTKAKQGEFPKVVFKFGNSAKNFTEVLNFYDGQLEFPVKPSDKEIFPFRCLLCYCKKKITKKICI